MKNITTFEEHLEKGMEKLGPKQGLSLILSQKHLQLVKY